MARTLTKPPVHFWTLGEDKKQVYTGCGFLFSTTWIYVKQNIDQEMYGKTDNVTCPNCKKSWEFIEAEIRETHVDASD